MPSKYAIKSSDIPKLPLGDDGKKKMHTVDRGLCVMVEPSKAGPVRSYDFVFRAPADGSKQVKRLGAITELTLSEARGKALEFRNMVREGKDPRHDVDVTAAGQETFIRYAERILPDLMRNRAVEWRYAVAKMEEIHHLPIGTITLDQVHRTIKTFWSEHPVSASRVIQKISKIFNHARVRGLRKDNPALLEDLQALGIQPARELAPIVKHPSLPFAELPGFMLKLRYETTITARCVEFAILIGARSQEARLARWDWLNADMTVITFPASVMKAGKVHVVPLAPQVTELLRKLPRSGDLIFPSPHTYGSDKPVRPLALVELVNRVQGKDAARVTMHGFRSTFRNYATMNRLEEDWVLELCIAHEIGSATVRAYRDDQILARRRAVMEAFATYATTPPAANVVPFNQAAA